MSVLQTSLSNGAFRMVLNRPEKRNALSVELIQALCDELAKSAAHTGTRVVLIEGAGKDFCAGMDLSELSRASADEVMQHIAMADRLSGLYMAVRNHPRPVISVVQGRALGGGAGLAMASDVILAAQSAQFGFPEVKIGFVPAIVSCMLKRLVGEKKAFDLLTDGDPFGAPKALDMGLITRIFPDELLTASATAYAETLASKSADAIFLTKRMLHQADGMTMEAAMRAGAEMNAISRMTEDAKRGFDGFVKKSR